MVLRTRPAAPVADLRRPLRDTPVPEAVQRAADEPPPLRFPWWRFIVGVVGCVVWAGVAINILGELDLAPPTEPLLSPAVAGASVAQWALAIALVSLGVCGVRLFRQD